LRRNGGATLYDPLMMIYHHVPAQRMTKEYFLVRRYWEGRSVAAWRRVQGGGLRQFAEGVARLTVTVPRDIVGVLAHQILPPRSRAFTYLCRLRRTQGYLDQMLQDLGFNIAPRL